MKSYYYDFNIINKSSYLWIWVNFILQNINLMIFEFLQAIFYGVQSLTQQDILQLMLPM